MLGVEPRLAGLYLMSEGRSASHTGPDLPLAMKMIQGEPHVFRVRSQHQAASNSYREPAIVPSTKSETVLCPAKLNESAGHFYELKKRNRSRKSGNSPGLEDLAVTFRYRRLREQSQRSCTAGPHTISDLNFLHKICSWHWINFSDLHHSRSRGE
jgi:hypothetical protein